MDESSDTQRVVGTQPTDTPAANRNTPPTSIHIHDLSRELIDALPAAVYATDAEGGLAFYNEAAAQLWGCRPALGEAKFCGSWKLYWPDGTPLPHDECPMALALRQRRPIRGMEAVAERPDGTRIPFIPYPTPLFDSSGRLTGAVNMLVDITERKRTEAELAERQAQLALFVEHAPAGIAMFDCEMRFLAVSRRFVVDHRLPQEAQLIGRSVYEVFPRIPLRWREIHVRALAGEELSEEEDQFIHQDGSTDWVRWSMVPWRRAERNIGGVLLFAELRTEQVEGRRALAESEARLVERQAQLDLAGKIARIGRFAYDHRTKKSQVSPGFATIYGLSEGTLEISSEEWRARVHPDDLPRLDAVVRHAFADGEREYVLEFRIFRDDQIRWLESRVLVSYNEAGKPIRRIGAQIDVTERKQAEQALAERNIQLGLAGKAALVGSFAYDTDTEIMQISEGYAAIHGLPEGTTEKARSECLASVHFGDIGRVRQLRSEAFRERRREYSVEYRVSRAGGELRWVETRCFISFSSAGEPHRVVGISIDMTERKRAEIALQASEAKLAGILAIAGEAILSIDGNHRITLFNEAAERLFGYSRGEMIGQPMDLLIPTRFRSAHHRHIEHFTSGPDIPRRMCEQREVPARRKNGEEFPIEASISKVKIGGEWISTVVLRDISERKHAEERQRALLAELDHRVKNALATVSCVVSQTRQESRSVATFAESLEARIRSMAAAHELLSSGRWQGISLAELVRRELAPYATPNNTEINGPDIMLTSEAGSAMAMVLHELVTNAAKYGALSTEKGRVSVRWDRRLSRHSRSHLVFEWQEIGGPPVGAPGKPSYGTTTIRDLIPYEFSGTVDLVFASDGVCCRLELPADWHSNDSEPASEARMPPIAPPGQ